MNVFFKKVLILEGFYKGKTGRITGETRKYYEVSMMKCGSEVVLFEKEWLGTKIKIIEENGK